MALTLCTTCERHVRVSETRCPFCDAKIAAKTAEEPRRALVTRAMAFAALALAASCEQKTAEESPPHSTANAPTSLTASASAMASSSVAPVASVAAGVPDAGSDAADDSAGDAHDVDAAKPAVKVWKKPPLPPNLAKPYGAPPADGLLA